ncbi:hypothetical protein [Arsenophonus nasoniae]|uniref:hypothetical protein n=1 Tax=Arsenophonus nasoniae TaxID=638 RepID=UPI0038791B43
MLRFFSCWRVSCLIWGSAILTRLSDVERSTCVTLSIGVSLLNVRCNFFMITGIAGFSAINLALPMIIVLSDNAKLFAVLETD